MNNLIIAFLWAAFGFVACLAIRNERKPKKEEPSKQRVLLPGHTKPLKQCKHTDEFKAILMDLTLIDKRHHDTPNAKFSMDDLAPRIERLPEKYRKIALAFRSGLASKITNTICNELDVQYSARQISPLVVHVDLIITESWARSHNAVTCIPQQRARVRARQEEQILNEA